MNSETTQDTLNLLLKTSRDGEQGFRLAAEEIEDPAIRRALSDRAQECARAAEELNEMIRLEGGVPSDSTSLAGDVHRGWVTAKHLLSGRGDLAIMAECERGEDLALSDYRTAIARDLPSHIRERIQRQLDGVQRNHDQIKALRDSLVGQSRSPNRERRSLERGGAGARSQAGGVMQWTLEQARVHPVRTAGVMALIGVAGWWAAGRGNGRTSV